MLPRHPRELTAAVTGECDPALRAVLADVIEEVGLVHAARPETMAPDVLLAVVSCNDATGVITSARSRAGGAPVVAILAMSDVQTAARAMAAGASACYALDTSLDRLYAILLAVLRERLAGSRRPA